MSTSSPKKIADPAAELAPDTLRAPREAADATHETVTLVHLEYQKYLDKRNAIRRETAHLRRTQLGLQLS